MAEVLVENLIYGESRRPGVPSIVRDEARVIKDTSYGFRVVQLSFADHFEQRLQSEGFWLDDFVGVEIRFTKG